uniref:Uncharacterized protein n=1 Tax=Amphimedon queenslandica TaxID=400682 RepID=A0A1X7UJX7_AMPQE
MAVNLAPKNKGRISAGVSTFITKDTKAGSVGRKGGVEFEGVLRKSFKCCGPRPSGPPADPAGKDRIACATRSGVMEECLMLEEREEKRRVGVTEDEYPLG